MALMFKISRSAAEQTGRKKERKEKGEGKKKKRGKEECAPFLFSLSLRFAGLAVAALLMQHEKEGREKKGSDRCLHGLLGQDVQGEAAAAGGNESSSQEGRGGKRGKPSILPRSILIALLWPSPDEQP